MSRNYEAHPELFPMPLTYSRRICCMCGCDPCETPGACRAEAKAEAFEHSQTPDETED